MFKQCVQITDCFLNILEPKETQHIRNIRAMFKGVEWGATYLDTYAIMVIGNPIE